MIPNLEAQAKRKSTAMRPYGVPPRDSSFSPPKPPPKPQSRPSLGSTIVKPLNTNSPVRRKPVPSSAFAQSSATTPTDSNGETFPSRAQPISAQQPTRPDQEYDLVPRDLDRSAVRVRTRPTPWANLAISRFPRGASPLLAQTKSLPSLLESLSERPQPLRVVPSDPPLPPAPAGGPEPPIRHVEAPSDDSLDNMALKPVSRPPPLRMDSTSSVKSLSANDAKKPQTPGGTISSFFGWKRTASPSTDSLSTENSDTGRSPGPSPFVSSPQTSAYSSRNAPGSVDGIKTAGSDMPQDSNNFGGPLHKPSQGSEDLTTKVALLEGELREISLELAGSIRREMELEDLVERLQTEVPSTSTLVDRTSDYFSDSGTSSIRPPWSDAGHGQKDDLDKIKRDLEQQKALIRVDLSQKWQNERTRRKALESHVQILEEQISSSRRDQTETSELTAKNRELETSLDDARRRLNEERKTKENFEDLLTALRVDLEQHRNERDNLRDEVVPQLKSQIEGLEGTLSDSQKQTYDLARMQQEIKRLKNENLALMQKNGLGIHSIAEDEISPNLTQQPFGLARSNSRAGTRGGLTRSGSVSRPATTPDSAESLPDKIKAVEQQRDALHTAVKYLLRRQSYQKKQFEKAFKAMEMERDRAITIGSPHKHGYEREVRGLRNEINLLRKRADDALEQKWQCEKGLGGLAKDLDRSRQETASLRQLLQEREGSATGSVFSSLEQAYDQLQKERKSVESSRMIAAEQKWADQLQTSADRAQELSHQVKEQLQTNSSLRNRLKDAVERGEQNQQAAALQINDLQIKLRKLEDSITAAQTQSETAVMKHEEEIRVLRASNNVQLLRAKEASLTPNARSPMTPLFTNSKRSPKLDKTTTGPGMALHQALKTEYLEHKVAELERALADAEKEMEQVVSRMNTAQISVAELQSERLVIKMFSSCIYLKQRQIHADPLPQRRSTSAES